MEKNKKDKIEDMIWEKVSIMIEIIMTITNCSYSDAYSIIQKSKTYGYLKERNYAVLHDSPQANLSSIGEELRARQHNLGTLITDANIILAMKKIREVNSEK